MLAGHLAISACSLLYPPIAKPEPPILPGHCLSPGLYHTYALVDEDCQLYTPAALGGLSRSVDAYRNTVYRMDGPGLLTQGWPGLQISKQVR